MTIAEVREKCKNVVAQIPRDMLILAVLILTSLLSFGFGYLAGRDSGQGSTVTLEESLFSNVPASGAAGPTRGTGQVVASKNGTKYYLPGCAGVDRISLANKIWFASTAAAVAAGYGPAANCKGI